MQSPKEGEPDFGDVRRHEAELVYLDLMYLKKQPNQPKHDIKIVPSEKLQRYTLHANMMLPYDRNIQDIGEKEPTIEMKQTFSTVIPVGTHENLTWERLASFCEHERDPCIAVVDSDGSVSYYKFDVVDVTQTIPVAVPENA